MTALRVISVLLFFFILSLRSGVGQTDQKELVWPAPPQQPRIKHVQTIASLKDVNSDPGFFEKVFRFFFGENETAHWLIQPVGIAIASDSRMYVADPGAKGIHIIDRNKKEYTFLSETKFGSFDSPVALAFAPDGALFISDSKRGEVIVLDDDNDGKFTIKEHLVRPTGLLVLGERLYVTDAGQHKVLVFDLKGNYVSEFGKRGIGSAEFNFPINLAGRTSLHIVDAMNHRIEDIGLDGSYISSFGQIGNAAGSFANPKSIALDSDDNMYVTDVLMDNFQVFNREGQLLLVVGSQGSSDGEFLSPTGIAIDGSDTIFVVDSMNKRIQIFKYLK